MNNTGDWAEASTTVVQVTKYYTFGGQRIALRQGDVVYYIHADHLGSTSLLSDASGNGIPGSRVSYYPYGETRTGSLASLPTDFGFTGQRNEGTIGLYDYRARFYDPVLGRFVQADTVVPEPGNPRDLNRYAYVRNSPLRYTDPSGHWTFEESPGDPYIWERDKPVNTLIRTAEPMVFWEETQDVGELVDQVMWHTVPSGIGQYGSISSGWNTFVGTEVSLEGGWVFNWRSGELSFTAGNSIAGEVGTPKLFGADLSGGFLLPMGYSSNEMLRGPSVGLDFALQADEIAELGLEAGVSREMQLVVVDPSTGQQRLVPVYDPNSNMQPYMFKMGLSVGANCLPNAIEASGSLGVSYTPFVRTVQLYPWKWGRRESR
ncbi:MAG: RHS repeat-associated core domain-containing protein [Anaerolineae bacterium]|nr:RHS repeat-associated core domain-containing protein [Anaerolineae bacterium]MDH7474986.1 RHS repeat-associated core domain-containing protein [Anaerolineae bacterium]